MANHITLCGLQNIQGFNPNGVYNITDPVDGKDAWIKVVSDPVLGARTFAVKYHIFPFSPTNQWNLSDNVNTGAWWAVGSDADSPWQSTWIANGHPYGIPVITEGNAGCATDPYAPWGGLQNWLRLRLLEYV